MDKENQAGPLPWPSFPSERFQRNPAVKSLLKSDLQERSPLRPSARSSNQDAASPLAGEAQQAGPKKDGTGTQASEISSELRLTPGEAVFPGAGSRETPQDRSAGASGCSPAERLRALPSSSLGTFDVSSPISGVTGRVVEAPERV